jgi:hypothetical protein
MKVFDIINEAPNFATQPVPGSTSGLVMPAGSKAAASAALPPAPPPNPNDKGLKLDPAQKRYKQGVKDGQKSWRFDNKKGIVIYDDKGVAKSYRPKDLIKEIGGTALQSQNSKVGKVLEKALSNKFVQGMQLLVAPYVIYTDWVEDVTAINVALENGFFNSAGDKATSEATLARTYFTHIAISKILTMIPASLVAVKTSAAIFRLFRSILLGLPGAGWIALLTTEAAIAAIFYTLNLETVQYWFVENCFNAAYPLAELGGGASWKIGTGNSATEPANKSAADAKTKVAPTAPATQPSAPPAASGNMTSQDAAKALGGN